MPTHKLLKVNRFEDEFEFLSNFSPHPIEFDGRTWPTAEHLFQAMKTTDPTRQEFIRLQPTPGKAKRAGHTAVLISDWEETKIQVMLVVIRAKFSQHPELQEKLLATGNVELVEGNHWGDRFWGVCNGRGSNNLGKILMLVRTELRQA